MLSGTLNGSPWKWQTLETYGMVKKLLYFIFALPKNSFVRKIIKCSLFFSVVTQFIFVQKVNLKYITVSFKLYFLYYVDIHKLE